MRSIEKVILLIIAISFVSGLYILMTNLGTSNIDKIKDLQKDSDENFVSIDSYNKNTNLLNLKVPFKYSDISNQISISLDCNGYGDIIKINVPKKNIEENNINKDSTNILISNIFNKDLGECKFISLTVDNVTSYVFSGIKNIQYLGGRGDRSMVTFLNNYDSASKILSFKSYTKTLSSTKKWKDTYLLCIDKEFYLLLNYNSTKDKSTIPEINFNEITTNGKTIIQGLGDYVIYNKIGQIKTPTDSIYINASRTTLDSYTQISNSDYNKYLLNRTLNCNFVYEESD